MGFILLLRTLNGKRPCDFFEQPTVFECKVRESQIDAPQHLDSRTAPPPGFYTPVQYLRHTLTVAGLACIALVFIMSKE
jgi:hypothetical protein